MGHRRKNKGLGASARRLQVAAGVAEERIAELEAEHAHLAELLDAVTGKAETHRKERDEHKQQAALATQSRDVLQAQLESSTLLVQHLQAQIAELQQAPPVAVTLAPPPVPTLPPDLAALYAPQPVDELAELKATVGNLVKRLGNDRARRAGTSMRTAAPMVPVPSSEKQFEAQRNDTPRASIMKAIAEVNSQRMNGAGYVR